MVIWSWISLPAIFVNLQFMPEFRLAAYTWNVGNIDPVAKNELKDIFDLTCSEEIDIYVIGLQEIQTGVQETVESFLKYDEWAVVLKNLFSLYGYYMIESVRVQGLSLNVFFKLKHLPFVRFIKTDIERTGIAGGFGNKGGVVVSANMYGHQICFLNSHLAAHLKNDKERVKDFKEIMDEIDFSGKASILSHDIVIWIGDTNFRLDTIDRKDVIKHISEKNYEYLWQFDQLKKHQKREKNMGEFIEGDLNFPPTYKYDFNTHVYDTSEKQRKPAWTDRVLLRIHPEINADATLKSRLQVDMIEGSYKDVHWCKASDHKPVTCSFNIQICHADTEPLVTMITDKKWGKDGGKISIKLHHGMEWDDSDYVAIYPIDIENMKHLIDRCKNMSFESDRDSEHPMEDFRDHAGWVYVPKNLTAEIKFPENQIPDGGRYMLAYYSKEMSSLIATSNVFEIMA